MYGSLFLIFISLIFLLKLCSTKDLKYSFSFCPSSNGKIGIAISPKGNCTLHLFAISNEFSIAAGIS